MSEPYMWRTQSGHAGSISRPLISPLAKALAVCGLFCALSLAIPQAYAETESKMATASSIVSEKASRGLLTDVARAGSRLVAVGERGHILYSDNHGKSWNQAAVPSRSLLTAVFFVDEKNGWAIGHDALILATTDGGQTWVEQYRDTEREEGAPFLDVWFKDASYGLVIGAYGALLETTDGGQTWTDIDDRLDNEDGYHLNAIAYIKDAGLFVVGEMGVMFRSSDFGQTWQRVNSPYDGSLFGVVATNQAQTLVVFGLRGNVFRSEDFGQTWNASPVKTARGEFEIGLSSGVLNADNSLTLVGHGGSVLTSKDSGRTFEAINRPDRLSLGSVAETDQGTLVLVGQGGVRVAAPTGLALTE